LIPAFAVDRTEVLLLSLRRLMQERRIPALPVYVDSPMALDALAVYRSAIRNGDPEIRPEIRGEADLFDTGNLIEARDTEASKAIHGAPLPAIIVSASGMATGGRILHHLARRLPEARNSVLLVGFQAEGTRGRTLLSGAGFVKLLGRYITVRAEVVDVPAFSVHADQGELLDWLAAAREPEVCFVVHGEPKAATTLRERIAAKLGWNAVVPRYDERVRIEPKASERRSGRTA
jgi:metallo-beta-lactamase family protein